MGKKAKDQDGLYEKYRVFKEPDDAETHPVQVDAFWMKSRTKRIELEEVEDFVFVLKPDTDPHALVALSAYAMSVKKDKPHLAADLWSVIFDN